jgi:hypothetical protein
MSGAISNVSRRMADAGEWLERAIGVVFLAAGLVVLVVVTCVIILFPAFTVLHNSDDWDFGGWSGQ